MASVKYVNPFITDKASLEEVAELIKVALPLMEENGRIPWAKVEAATGIGYSRGWLIVRHAWLSANAPQLLVDWKPKYEAALAQATAAGNADAFLAKEVDAKGEAIPGAVSAGERRVLSPIVHDLRDGKALSWGEISVRMGIPESRVRKFYRASGAKKDKGLRIGKGGRFAYQDPTLYLEHRKLEGAQIPVDLKGRPTPDKLLNFKKDEVKVSTKKAPAKKTA
jgi:hypothetical protein